MDLCSTLLNTYIFYQDHLILNPDDADGWCELGACFQLRADVELDWSASNIGGHRDLIGEYQRVSTILLHEFD